MKSFSIYGNCQAKALMQTLLKNEVFANTYNYKDLKPIQTILEEEVHLAEAIFKEADLLLHQIVSNSYHIPSLRTASLKAYRKINSLSIAFPYTYFNAYFPELDTYHGTKSILSLVHDYNIMLGYVKGLSQQQISDLIQDQNFYSQPITLTIRNESIDSLSWRENLLETKISNYILHNYTKIKLFNIFNHPKGIIFDHIANQVFTLLKMPTIEESLLSETYLDSKSIIAPIYPST
ncbi:hypothetical protein KJ988_02320, partial [bacterium]|nr:hypothetical protein [bacterium]